MSAWTPGAPLPQEMPSSADVAIVGMTPQGLTLAAVLARSGARVVVIDTDTTLGSSGASVGTGHVFQGMTESLARLDRSVGRELTQSLVDLGTAGRNHLVQQGLAQVMTGVWRGRGEREVRELSDTAEVLSACGGRAWMEGDDLWLAGEALVDPAASQVALAHAAQQAGARLVGGVELCDLSDQALLTRHGVLEVELVVVAGDLRLAAAHAFFPATLLPYREHAALYAADAPATVERSQFGYFTLRPHPRGALVRGARWATQHMEAGETDPVTLAVVQDRIDDFAQRRLGTTEALARWAWIETTTCDGLPLVGAVTGSPRLLVCTGFGPSDWSLGVGCALALGASLVGDDPAPTARLSPSRMVL